MTTPKYQKLLDKSQWQKIAKDALSGNEGARTEMWFQVIIFVEQVAVLKVGALNEDEGFRRDIAVQVMQKLEAHDRKHLRSWYERQLTDNGLHWWAFILLVARRLGIDAMRTSRRNLARRGEPCVWPIEVSLDVLEKTVRSTTKPRDDDDQSAVRALYDRLDHYQEMRNDATWPDDEVSSVREEPPAEKSSRKSR